MTCSLPLYIFLLWLLLWHLSSYLLSQHLPHELPTRETWKQLKQPENVSLSNPPCGIVLVSLKRIDDQIALHSIRPIYFVLVTWTREPDISFTLVVVYI